MSRNASGTYTLPSGNPVVTSTTITSTWANTTMTDIGAELTNSLDRAGRGAMTGPLSLADGAIGAPGLTFGTETNSGDFRAGSHDIRRVINGANTQQWVAGATRGPDGTVSLPGWSFINQTGCGLYVIGANDIGMAINGAKVLEFKAAQVDLPNKLTFSMANPAGTAAFSNTLTPLNIPKVWATLSLNGSVSPTVNSSFNLTSAVSSTTITTLTLAQAMADTLWCPILTLHRTGGANFSALTWNVTSVTTTTVVFKIFQAGTLLDPTDAANNDILVHLVGFGAQ